MEMGVYQQQHTQFLMTQELKQAIQVLQYSTADLREFLKEQALDNPLIELSESAFAQPLFQSPQKISTDAKHRALENHSDTKSIYDILTEQVSYMNQPLRDRNHLIYFIHSLNEDGYLTVSLEELCDERGISLQLGESYIRLLQDLEPTGVGARSMKECLLLQLKKHPKWSALAEEVVLNHMERLASRRWKEIARLCEAELSDIQKVHDLISQLDPHPGKSFSKELPHFIEADVMIEIGTNEEPVIKIQDSLLGNVQIHLEYKHQLLTCDIHEHVHYAKQKLKEAEWLIQSLTQRQQTIYRVAKVIATHQKDFLTTKHGKMNPLTLKEIAESIGVHESTVSRATTNKYAQTPRGLVELKSLLSAGHQSKSKDTLKTWLKEFIESENKQQPYSDQDLVQMYQEKGVELSRRAIAKYRGELGIYSSPKRKRYK
ncbi:RNA polymerase factor sigma-54 [Alkalicoccobacillus porphyridii]|uniref:RNA polymerase factor sigma-54 n=1 Tax=Alkalicoccobacillus porphyridii TaxID=2597270 RepID=A0A554A1V3_9BACI|nr:RNA polymerase factor sigma-54 [Alkalicoccobacillus porphyridii]TSB47667.1 RNA polymerase factor sigma-54 [Alkalicoccobacillus porphyridii]